MQDEPLFSNTDAQESAFAPQQLPGGAQDRVRADEGTRRNPGDADAAEPPDAAPVANLGTAPSAAAALPGVDEDGEPAGSDPEVLGSDRRGRRDT